MPFLSISRSAALETRSRTQRFSVSTQKRRYCRFGRNRRLVLLLAWETLFPTIGPLPVTSQTRAIGTLFLEQLAPRATQWMSVALVVCSLPSPEIGWRYPGCQERRHLGTARLRSIQRARQFRQSLGL